MNKDSGSAHLSPNKNGSMVGSWNGIVRTAAHTYVIPTSKLDGPSYYIYVQSIKPPEYRCQCWSFLTLGRCKHGPVAVAFEAMVKKEHPREYRAEKRRQAEHQAKARVKEYWICP